MDADLHPMAGFGFVQQQPGTAPCNVGLVCRDGTVLHGEGHFPGVVEGEIDGVKQIHRLHHHLHDVVPIGHAMGNIQIEIELCRTFNLDRFHAFPFPVF